jgi:hypothetical protein
VYGWIWRHLPGCAAAKLGCTLALAIAAAALLWIIIFPWITPLLPLDRVMPGG